MLKRPRNIDKSVLTKDVYCIINELGYVDWEGGWPSFSIKAGEITIIVSYNKGLLDCSFYINEYGNCVCIGFYENNDEVSFINTDNDIVECVTMEDINDTHMNLVNLQIEDLPVIKDYIYKMHIITDVLMGCMKKM